MSDYFIITTTPKKNGSCLLRENYSSYDLEEYFKSPIKRYEEFIRFQNTSVVVVISKKICRN